MSKQISPRELAEIVTLLLMDPDATNGFDSDQAHMNFMQDVGAAVANACGGEAFSVIPAADPSSGNEFERNPSLSVWPNESLPSMNNNVWSPYDRYGWEEEKVEGVEDGDEMTEDQVQKIRHSASMLLTRPQEARNEKNQNSEPPALTP